MPYDVHPNAKFVEGLRPHPDDPVFQQVKLDSDDWISLTDGLAKLLVNNGEIFEECSDEKLLAWILSNRHQGINLSIRLDNCLFPPSASVRKRLKELELT